MTERGILPSEFRRKINSFEKKIYRWMIKLVGVSLTAGNKIKEWGMINLNRCVGR